MNPVLFILSILFFMNSGCKTDTMENPGYKEKLKYLALGDSYTIGEGMAENERYPALLLDSLQAAGIEPVDLQIIARTGWTTDELSEAIDTAQLTPPYDLVTLLIGVNNQYRGRTPDSYRPEFVNLLTRAVEYAGGSKERVIVLSIPDWGVTPFAEGRDREQIALEIDAYNAINREESEKAGVAWVDVTPISREASSRTDLLAPDGLHPSGVMYKYWVHHVFPLAVEMLKGGVK